MGVTCRSVPRGRFSLTLRQIRYGLLITPPVGSIGWLGAVPEPGRSHTLEGDGVTEDRAARE